MHDALKTIQKEADMTWSKYFSEIFLQELSKTIKTHRQVRYFPAEN
jgi:hypothetical protein